MTPSPPRRFSPAWWAERATLPAQPGVLNPTVARFYRVLLGPLLRLAHRPRLEGAEHLPPADRPCLIVANHSAGMAISELTCLALLATTPGHPLQGRRVAGMAHPFAFFLTPLPTVMGWLGAIPSTYRAAGDALGSGASVLVFPGGDHESCRPIWQAGRVDFGGRVGFLRLAARAGVPIVPLRITGSHWTAPILLRSRLLPRLLFLPWLFGLKRYPLSLLGLVGIGLILWLGHASLGWPLAALLAWLWMNTPLTLCPIVPATLRYQLGPPLELAELGLTGSEPDEASLRAAYAQVVERIQGMGGGRS